MTLEVANYLPKLEGLTFQQLRDRQETLKQKNNGRIGGMPDEDLTEMVAIFNRLRQMASPATGTSGKASERKSKAPPTSIMDIPG